MVLGSLLVIFAETLKTLMFSHMWSVLLLHENSWPSDSGEAVWNTISSNVHTDTFSMLISNSRWYSYPYPYQVYHAQQYSRVGIRMFSTMKLKLFPNMRTPLTTDGNGQAPCHDLLVARCYQCRISDFHCPTPHCVHTLSLRQAILFAKQRMSNPHNVSKP